MEFMSRLNEETNKNSQHSHEKPLRFEAPRRGYYGKAGFVAIKAGKKLPLASI
jgi:hypothetical protein